MTFTDVIAIVVPLVVPIAVGWLLVQVRLLGKDAAHPLTTIYLYVCAPALLITVLAGEDLSQLLDARFIAGAAALYLGSFGVVYLYFRRVQGRSGTVSTMGGANAAAFNAGTLGLPILLGVFGPSGVGPVVITIILFLLLLLPVMLALLTLGESDEGEPMGRASLRGLRTALRNPILIASFIGLGLAAFDVTLPTIVESSLETLGNATVLTALLALGMTIELTDLRHGGREIYAMASVRVLVVPAVAALLSLSLGVHPVLSAAFVVAFSLPTAKLVFVLSEQHHAYERQTAGIVALTTVAAVITLPLWVIVANHFWPSAFAT